MLSNIITNVRRALDNTARYYRGGVADEKIFSTLILTYHQIGREAYSDYPSLYVSARNFLLHMRVLKLLGYSSFYVYELIDYWKKGKPLPPRSFVVTFDDGFRGVYEFAYPILCRYNFKATVFIIAKTLTEIFPVTSFPFLTLEQIKEMMSNRIRIGSHASSHEKLSILSPQDALSEILESKFIIQQVLNTNVYSFSYPHNIYNQFIMSEVKEAGYVCACTTRLSRYNSLKNLFELNRISMPNIGNIWQLLYRLSVVSRAYSVKD